MKFELTEMDFGTIIDRGIKLFKDNFVSIITVMAIFMGPMLLVMNYASAYMQSKLGQGGLLMNLLKQSFNPGQPPDPEAFFDQIANDYTFWISLAVIYGIAFILLLVTPIAYISIFRILSQYVVGVKEKVGDAVRFALSRYWILLGASMLAGIIASFSGIIMLCPCLIPVWLVFIILFATFTMLLPCVVTMEEGGSMYALKRTWNLLKGHWWRAFGIYLLTAIIIGVITYIFSSVGMLLTGLIPGQAGFAGASAVATMFSIIFQPVTWTVMFLVYLDIRIRKENFDLDILAQRTIGPSTGEPDKDNTGGQPGDTWT